MADSDGQGQTREKWTGRLDPKLIALVREVAVDTARSEGYVVELALGEMFKNRLPGGWKAGGKIQ